MLCVWFNIKTCKILLSYFAYVSSFVTSGYGRWPVLCYVTWHKDFRLKVILTLNKILLSDILTCNCMCSYTVVDYEYIISFVQVVFNYVLCQTNQSQKSGGLPLKSQQSTLFDKFIFWTEMNMAKPEPAEIEFKGMKFLVTDRPSDLNMDKYIEVSK